MAARTLLTPDAAAPSSFSPGAAHVAVVDRRLKPSPGEARRAQALTRDRMSDLGVDQEHVRAVNAVVDEFMALAVELGSPDTVRLTIEPFHLFTSVRLRCSQRLGVRDAPFGAREGILEKLTFAHGTRGNADGTEDMWAEVVRSNPR